MLYLFRLLTSYPVQFAYFAVLLIATTYWAFNGWKFCETASQSKAEKTVTALTEKVRQKDPVLAVELDKLQNDYDIGVLAATLKEREKFNGVNGLTFLAEQVKSQRAVYDLQLARTAVQPQYVPVSMRKDFLETHGTFLQQIDFFRQHGDINLQSGINSETEKYLAFLEDAKKQPDIWQKAKDDPLFVFLAIHGVKNELLTFYDKEKIWLDDVLFLLITSVDEEMEIDFNSVLSVIEKYHPAFRDAIAVMGKQLAQDKEHEKDSVAGIISIFQLFNNYGDVISTCVDNKIPLDELLNVMLANPDFCEQYEKDLVARLVKIHSEQPDTWKSADQPLVLQFSQDVPNLANELNRKYPAGYIASLLYLKYDDCVPQAAAAIDRFGDLAILVLNQYCESELFKKHLKDKELGVRIIPFVADSQKGDDQGLEQLAQNKKWLDKYFDTEGNLKEEEWWTILPGGALVKFGKNVAAGLPNTWSELGWAGLDVADAALLIVTMGASTVVTASKTTSAATGKATVKVGSKLVLKETADAVAKSAGRRTVTMASERLPVLARLTRLAETNRVVRWTLSGGKFVYRVYEVGIKTPLRVVGQSVYKTAKVVGNPKVARALLTVGIAMTLYCRTFPGLPEALRQFGEMFGQATAQLAKTTAETVAAALYGFLNEFLQPMNSNTTPYLVFFGTLIVFAIFTLWFGKRLLLKPARV